MGKAKLRKVSTNFDEWIRTVSAQSRLDGVEITRILGARLQGVIIDQSGEHKKKRLKRTERNLIDEFFRDDLI